MNILVVISEAPPITSGVARVCDEITSRLRAAGHRVDIISSANIPRMELGEVRLSSMVWRGFGQVYQRLHEYDVIHVHGPTPTFSDTALLLAALGRRRGGPAIVYTHHCEIELPGKELLCAPYNIMHRLLARLADHVVVSTPGYADSFAAFVPKAQVSVIPWGVNITAPVAPKPAGLNVLFVGQLRPYKGLDVLLRAMRRVEGATLTVVGNGHQAESYHELARELDLQNVTFLGPASDQDVRRAYEHAHVLVLPSRSRAEAFGLVLLEGMAAGCVPVASRLMGLTDVIGEVGRTFTPGDNAELAAVLNDLKGQGDGLTELGAQSRRWAEQFSWDTAARGYEHLFVTLARQRNHVGMDWFPYTIPATSAAKQNAAMHTGPLSAVFDLHHMLRPLFDHIVDRFGASRASLLLQPSPDAELVISAQKGLDNRLLGAHVSRHNSVAGWVVEKRQPLYISPSMVPEDVRPYLRAPSLSSALSVPILFNNEVHGVLSVARQANEHAYKPDDLPALVSAVGAFLQKEILTNHDLRRVSLAS